MPNERAAAESLLMEASAMPNHERRILMISKHTTTITTNVSQKNWRLPIFVPKSIGLRIVRPSEPPVMLMLLKSATITKLMPMVVMARKSACNRREIRPSNAPHAPVNSMAISSARKKFTWYVCVRMAAV